MSLPEPFFVLATQNPIEQEGTYPLPEAQLDRFLFDIRIGYPGEDEEIAILRARPASRLRRSRRDRRRPKRARCSGSRAKCRRPSRCCGTRPRSRARRVPIRRPRTELVKRYVRWGAGPRAGQALILGAKAAALLAGRMAVAPEDIRRVARPVLRHRVLPNFAAEAEGVNSERIVEDLLARVEPPRSDFTSDDGGRPYGALLDSVRGVQWPARRAVGGAPRRASSRARAASRASSPNTARTGRATIRGGSTGNCSRAAIARSSGSRPIARCCRRTIVLDASASMAYPGRDARTSGGARRRSRSDWAAVVHADGDPVGLAVHDDTGICASCRRARGAAW